MKLTRFKRKAGLPSAGFPLKYKDFHKYIYFTQVVQLILDISRNKNKLFRDRWRSKYSWSNPSLVDFIYMNTFLNKCITISLSVSQSDVTCRYWSNTTQYSHSGIKILNVVSKRPLYKITSLNNIVTHLVQKKNVILYLMLLLFHILCGEKTYVASKRIHVWERSTGSLFVSKSGL